MAEFLVVVSLFAVCVSGVALAAGLTDHIAANRDKIWAALTRQPIPAGPRGGYISRYAARRRKVRQVRALLGRR